MVQKRRGSKASGLRRKRALTAPQNPAQFFAKPARSRETWINVTGVLSKMRAEKLSLQQASKEIGVSPRTVTRLAGSALKKTGGRYQVKKSDQFLRVMKIPGAKGLEEIGIKGSKQATLLGEYWSAVDRYLRTGDSTDLDKFKNKVIKDAEGKPIALITDRKELNRLGGAGVLSFESIYARSK